MHGTRPGAEHKPEVTATVRDYNVHQVFAAYIGSGSLQLCLSLTCLRLLNTKGMDGFRTLACLYVSVGGVALTKPFQQSYVNCILIYYKLYSYLLQSLSSRTAVLSCAVGHMIRQCCDCMYMGGSMDRGTDVKLV